MTNTRGGGNKISLVLLSLLFVLASMVLMMIGEMSTVYAVDNTKTKISWYANNYDEDAEHTIITVYANLNNVEANNDDVIKWLCGSGEFYDGGSLIEQRGVLIDFTAVIEVDCYVNNNCDLGINSLPSPFTTDVAFLQWMTAPTDSADSYIDPGTSINDFLNSEHGTGGLYAKYKEGSGSSITAVGIQGKVWYVSVVKPILNVLNIILFPLIVISAALGMIFVIKLGVSLTKAESADKRSEAKTKTVYFIVAFVATLVILILLKMFTANADIIFNWLMGYDGK